jgi:hypothetical protein
MKEAKKLVTVVPDYDFKHFGALINQLGRRMKTMTINSLWMHMDTRRYRAINTSLKSLFPWESLSVAMNPAPEEPEEPEEPPTEKARLKQTKTNTKNLKSTYHFMTKYVMWAVSGAPVTSDRKPNPNMYKKSRVEVLKTVVVPLLDNLSMNDLIMKHKSKLDANDITVCPQDGVFTEKNITDHPNVFFRYITFLFDSLSTPDGKAPFQLVPQYTMKRRCITMGVDQITGMMMRFQDAEEGIIDTIGIDTSLIRHDRQSIFESANEKQIQSKQKKLASHEKKRKRMESYEDELKQDHPNVKRRRTVEGYLVNATKAFEESKLQLAKKLAVKPPPLSKKKNPELVDSAEWKLGHRIIAPLLFYPPKDVKKTWNGIITTDGISCSWHRVTEDVVVPKPKLKSKSKSSKKAPVSVIVPLSELGRVDPQDQPKEYGNHGESVWIDRGPLNIVAVDPGHATLIDAIRYHHDGAPSVEPLPDNNSKRHRRRHGLQTKLAEKDRTHFSLTNVHWQTVCGLRAATAKRRLLMSMMKFQPAVDLLAQHSSKVSSSAEYKLHMRARLQTLDVMKKYVKAKAPRRWKFECHRKEQLAIHQLSKDLFSGFTGPSILVWGDGGFGPTSRGHASAPNKRLRRLLSKYIPVIVSSEHLSSQRSACCHHKMKDCRRKLPGMKRVTVKQCNRCKTLLARDVSAACVILDIFEFQRQGRVSERPALLS